MFKCWKSLLLAVLCAGAGCEVSSEPQPPPGDGPALDSGTTERSEAPPPAPLPEGRRVALGRMQFVQGYRPGYERALREGKPMLIFFTAEWCHFCHQMQREAFASPQVGQLADRFVCILVDADAEQQVCTQFQVQRFPTIQFLSPRGVPLNRLEGKRPSEQVLLSMREALQATARRQELDPEAIRR